MANSEQNVIKNALSLKSIEGLTDGVFAIVMTLLVLGLAIPMFTGNSMNSQLSQLFEMWPKFACYFVTFLMLGYIWSVHHRVFSFMKCSDSVSIWLNIICMMFASLLPFSTSLLAKYVGQQLPIIIYEGNYFMISLIGYLNWLYVAGKYRLVNMDIESNEIRRRKIVFLSSMVFTAIAIGISYLNPVVSMSFFIVYLVSGMVYTAVLLRVCPAAKVAK